MENAERYARDSIKDTTDPEITRRLYQTLKPEWLMPNVRLKQQHFLPKHINLVMTDQEVQIFIHSLNEKLEVYSYVRRLFEEHNACARVFKYRCMFMESSHLFCMDIAESSMSSNFFMYIPKSYYRRFLEDVPLLYNTKACIIVDYHRRLAYRFGICISKLTEELDAHSEDYSSVVETSTDRSTTTRGVISSGYQRRRVHDVTPSMGKIITINDIIATNRQINSKKNDNRS